MSCTAVFPPLTAATRDFRREWSLPTIFGRAFVVLQKDLRKAESPLPVPPDLQGRLESVLRDTPLLHTIFEIGRVVDPQFHLVHRLIPAHWHYLAASLASAFRQGKLAIVPFPREEKTAEFKDDSPPVSPAPPKKVKKKTWVKFQFVYPDDTPVSDLAYVVEDAEGIQERGILGIDGKVERSDVPEGNYAVIFEAIEGVAWNPRRARCDETVRIAAKTMGYSYGTRAKVNIYREFRETEADLIQSIQTKVENDAIDVEWKYDYTATEARKAETGIARFIAEIELEQGKLWEKSRQPLQLELKSIEKVAWSVERVEAGGVAHVEIETLGFPDGADVTLELWRFIWDGSKKVGDLKSIKLNGGKATTSCAYAQKGSSEFTITQSGEYFMVVKIEGSVVRTARSGLLWCVYAEEPEPQPVA